MSSLVVTPADGNPLIITAHVNKVEHSNASSLIWSVQIEGNPQASYYASEREACETAVCVALENVSRHVARGQLYVKNGLSVQVVIKRKEPA